MACRIGSWLVLSCAALACSALQAQSGTAQPPSQGPAQRANTKPPLAQAWIDVATFSGPGFPMGPGGGNPLSALGGLFGGGGGDGGPNRFLQTQTAQSGRWVDVTLMSRQNPTLAEARQAVPAGFLSPALTLQAPPPAQAKPAPDEDEQRVVEREEPERPKGRILLYWGCGAAVRAGQPRVLEMANMNAADAARFFVARRATQRGAHAALGRPVWPSQTDTRMVPASASLVGEHAFSGAGVPEGFRFQVPPAQDLMPPFRIRQINQDGALALSWAVMPQARAYFLGAMGNNTREDMVIWTSSEQPDTGFGLLDYQTNPAVDRWLGEKVLLSPSTTECTIPKGIFGSGQAMVRAIAYGHELNLVHPPRPADPRAVWEPIWAVKVRVKSVAMVMPGMDADEEGGPGARERGGQPGSGSAREPAAREPAPPAQRQDKADPLQKPLDLLRGILGR